MSLIVDRKQYNKFLSLLPELERDQVYFLSLSARNKYLTERERLMYELGRTEMFSRQIAYDKPGIEYALDKMEAELMIKKTRAGKNFPEKSLVVYFNINPSSTIMAFKNFKSLIDEMVYKTMFLEKSEDKWEKYTRLNRYLMNEIQKARSSRKLVDIDIDLGGYAKHEMEGTIKDQFSKFDIVSTKSGFHVLLLPEQAGLVYKRVNHLDAKLKEKGGECKFNSNAMIPLPGTLQAGHLIHFWGI